MKIAALLLLCLPCFAQSTRVRCEHMEGEKLITAWGTAVCFDGRWVTCAHNIEDAETIHMESRGSWIRCDVKKKPKDDLDLALLKPDMKIDTPDEHKHGTYCYGSAEGKPIKRLDAEIISSKPLGEHVKIKGMAHGLSGSAITVDGQVAGIVTGFAGIEKNGKLEWFKDCAFFISAERIKEFLK